MLQDIPRHDDMNQQQFTMWKSPLLWTLIERGDANHLMQKLENSGDESTGECFFRNKQDLPIKLLINDQQSGLSDSNPQYLIGSNPAEIDKRIL